MRQKEILKALKAPPRFLGVSAPASPSALNAIPSLIGCFPCLTPGFALVCLCKLRKADLSQRAKSSSAESESCGADE